MWPFKKKEKQEEYKKYPLPTSAEILDGADPFHIDKVPVYIRGNKESLFVIYVFRFDISRWCELTVSSNLILGIEYQEFLRMMNEKHNGIIVYEHNISQEIIAFKDYETAKRELEEFRPYYEKFHMPRALMKRLSFYTEGGYPPYFDNCDFTNKIDYKSLEESEQNVTDEGYND